MSFKVVMVADPYVGNTAILTRYVDGTYDDYMLIVIGELL